MSSELTVLEHNNHERMVPEITPATTFWEHVYRYAFASRYVSGKSVLDVACGEGYGSAALLSAGASQVIGVDVSEAACLHAKRKYGIDARHGSAEKLPLGDRSVEVVVSFETIEHVSNPHRFLDECARVLAPGGLLIISTPNKGIYLSGLPQNPHHCSEMTEQEFSNALADRFRGIKFYTQHPRSASWWSVRTLAADIAPWTRFRPMNLIHRYVQFGLVSDTLGEPTPKQRAAITDLILRISHNTPNLLNPYELRPLRRWTGEKATYLIATAVL